MEKINTHNLKFSLIEQAPPTHPIYEAIRNKLKSYNTSQVGDYKINTYLFVYHNENNDLVAGLCAFCRLGAFYIELLWVDESLREQSLGSKLLEEAEKCAYKDGAHYMKVNTASFQALDFYLKNGYEVFAKLPLFIEGMNDQEDYFLVKYL